MMYHYTPEVTAVLAQLKEVRKMIRRANTPDIALDESYASVLRQAYLTGLKVELLSLHCLLDDWVQTECQMEVQFDGNDES